MKQIAVAIVALCILLWGWSGYFRKIPNLQNAPAKEKYVVEKGDDFSSDYIVAGKKYYDSGVKLSRYNRVNSRPVFSDFSAVDLVLIRSPYARTELAEQLDFSQKRRCFNIKHMPEQPGVDENIFNINAIAASESVANSLRNLKTEKIVRITGYVAYVRTDNQFLFDQPIHRNTQCKTVVIESLTVLA